MLVLAALAPALSPGPAIAGRGRPTDAHLAGPELETSTVDSVEESLWALGPAPGANVTGAWERTHGDPGTTVAVLDSGVDRSHEALEDVLPGWDPNNGDLSAEDDCGHGTKVAGILDATRDHEHESTGITDARILPVKVLAESPEGCTGPMRALAEGIEWATTRGADVIAVPLGCPSPCWDEAVEEAVEQANAAGALVVASAGNEPDEGLYFPASLPGALAVASLEREDQPSHGTFPGGGPDLLAPGEELATTAPGNEHTRFSGASAAVPVVAGVATLVLSMADLPPAVLADVLQESARDLDRPSSVQGQGAIDAGAAVDLAKRAISANAPDRAHASAQASDAGPERVSATMLDLSALWTGGP